MRQIKASLFLIVLARAALAGDRPATAQEVIAAAEQEGKLVIYSTTDTIFVGPLLKDFNPLYPKVSVQYDDLNSTELYNQVIAEVAAGNGSADLLWSSAIDLQLQLADDAYAPAHLSHSAPNLPRSP